MLVVVTTVSALVHLYSIGYMAEDPYQPRFFAYLSLFTFAMLMLVTADNLVQLFFGWEGVGLASYLLIGFWYQKPSANAAAIKAFVVNRVGDFGFALGIFAVFMMTGAVDFDTSLRAGAGARRQDHPLHRLGLRRADPDLPAAVHGRDGQVGAVPAAHLAAGRDGGPDPGLGADPRRHHGDRGRLHGGAALAAVRARAETAQTFVTIIGATTAFFAATVGLVQNDIKRVIAYSTCSQLGYMFVALGVGAYSIGMFHLFTHAFFKALLFLGAGSVITAMHHEQDMRNMGGLRTKIPFTYVMMVVGTLALTGFPLTAGYFSKDAIIEAAYASTNPAAFYGYLMTLVAAGLTAFYSWRLMLHDLPRPAARPRRIIEAAHESPLHRCSSRCSCWRSARSSPGWPFDDIVRRRRGSRAFFRDSLKLSTEQSRPRGRCTTIEQCLDFRRCRPSRWRSASASPGCSTSAARTSRSSSRASSRSLYQFLLNKWYFDETLRLPLRAPDAVARPPVLEGRRRLAHRRLRARRRVGAGASTSPATWCGCRPATSTTTPSPC